MDKTYRTELRRIFLIEALPEPLTRASAHIQLFDNYIAGTRLRLRSVRDPESRDWNRILQQHTPASENDLSAWKVAEIYLNEAEYAHFEIFEGTEIRKNRYFHEFSGKMISFDVYLGKLWGLNIAIVEFEEKSEMENFVVPSFAAFEVTNDVFFTGSSLVEKKFDEIQSHLAAIDAQPIAASSSPED